VSLGVTTSVVGAQALRQSMKRAQAAMLAEENRFIGAAAARVERFVKVALQNPAIGPGRAGPSWYVSSSTYDRSIRSKLTRGTPSRKAVGIVGTNFVGAGLHEFGRTRSGADTIRPKRKKWLTIPTQFAQQGTRIARASSRSDLVFLPTRRPNLARLVKRVDLAGGQTRPPVVFWLVKEAKIKKRPMWAPAQKDVSKWVRQNVPRRLRRAMRSSVGRGR